MPGATNKIIINRGGNRGMSKLIDADLDTLELLGREMQELAMLEETTDIRDKMAVACGEHYDAQLKYHNFCRDLIAEIAHRIDKKLGLA